MFKFQYQNGKKRKYEENFSGLQNGAIKGLQIEAGFRTTNRGKRDYKYGQLKGFQIEVKRLQIGATRFKIGADIKNRENRDFKLG